MNKKIYITIFGVMATLLLYKVLSTRVSHLSTQKTAEIPCKGDLCEFAGMEMNSKQADEYAEEYRRSLWDKNVTLSSEAKRYEDLEKYIKNKYFQLTGASRLSIIYAKKNIITLSLLKLNLPQDNPTGTDINIINLETGQKTTLSNIVEFMPAGLNQAMVSTKSDVYLVKNGDEFVLMPDSHLNNAKEAYYHVEGDGAISAVIDGEYISFYVCSTTKVIVYDECRLKTFQIPK